MTDKQTLILSALIELNSSMRQVASALSDIADMLEEELNDSDTDD